MKNRGRGRFQNEGLEIIASPIRFPRSPIRRFADPFLPLADSADPPTRRLADTRYADPFPSVADPRSAVSPIRFPRSPTRRYPPPPPPIRFSPSNRSTQEAL